MITLCSDITSPPTGVLKSAKKNLGKVGAYQLSYFRDCDAKVGIIFESASICIKKKSIKIRLFV